MKNDYFYESHKWSRLRYMALRRDKFRCLGCGASRETGAILHVDHIKPRSKYPKLELCLENLQTLCAACNVGKSNLYEDDFRKRTKVREAVQAFARRVSLETLNPDPPIHVRIKLLREQARAIKGARE